jgi:hypothetical protein
MLICAIFFSMGLSRERVRQVGLVALEKLKHAARKRNTEAMLVKHWVLCVIQWIVCIYTERRNLSSISYCFINRKYSCAYNPQLLYWSRAYKLQQEVLSNYSCPKHSNLSFVLWISFINRYEAWSLPHINLNGFYPSFSVTQLLYATTLCPKIINFLIVFLNHRKHSLWQKVLERLCVEVK